MGCFMFILIFLLYFLSWVVVGKIVLIFMSKGYGKHCHYNCNKCKMWSCTYNSGYEDFEIFPYDDFSNVCGKF